METDDVPELIEKEKILEKLSEADQNSEVTSTPTENGVEEGKEESDSFPISVKTCGEKRIVIPLQVSPADNLQDIRQFLYESVDTCYITCYHLYLNGKKLNDYSEIHEVENIAPNCALEMVEGLYDERSVRAHVRRLREIMSPPPQYVSPSVFSRITKEAEEKEKQEKTIEGKAEAISNAVEVSAELLEKEPSLLDYYPPSHSNMIPCLKSIIFSGWNPPPGYRKLLGDLLYLEVTTLDNRTFHITGCSSGFYLNGTSGSVFNPLPHPENSYKSHTLVGLLQKLSPSFKKNFHTLLTTNFQDHPFEVLPVPFPVYPWLAKKEPHNYDLNRAEDSILLSSETDLRGQLRDWNEEYQACKELPSDTIQERIIRDRALYKVNCDFVEASVKGAIAIIEKSIAPINPLDPERAHMFIYNNIFFSYALDGRDFYKEFGGDRAAYVNMNNDLKGIRALNKVDIKGLHTLCTTIIDYKGHRVCAQSIIPGILQREQTSTVVYGSIDTGKKISSDAAFHELMLKVGKELHIKEHIIVDDDGKEVKLCSPIESKGIIGTDGRKYVLDLNRITARDSNYAGKTNITCVLRSELIQSYYEYLKETKRRALEKQFQEKQLAEQKAKEQNSEKKEENSESKKEEVTESKKEEVPNEEKKDDKPEQQEEFKINEEELVPNFALNPNVFCDLKLGGTPEEIEQDEELVKKASTFLKDHVLPVMVDEFSWFVSLPVDGQTLTATMHSKGINIRYLGAVATLAENAKLRIVKDIAVREMICRAVKYILREVIVDVEDMVLAPVVSHFLNCMFGEVAEPPQKAVVNKTSGAQKKNKKKNKNAKKPITESLYTNKLWTKITNEVKERFQYDLPDRKSLKEITHNIATLRAVSQKLGLQLEARDYVFTSESPFKPEDLLNIYPLVKHCNPETSDAKNLLEAGKSFIQQGRIDIAYELLSEALAIFHQVYGPMHKDTANCYSNLAMVLYHAKDVPQAVDHQQKAAVINERVQGLDHYDTAQSYGNLALFIHTLGKFTTGLSFIRRCLFLSRLTSGANHPETASTFTNIAMMLQDMQQPKQSIEYLLQALKSYETFLGPNNIQTAAIYHAIAIAFSQMEQFKEALIYEKKNYNILVQRMGENDFRVLESNIYLKQFTQKAVAMQIENKKAQQQLKQDNSLSGLQKTIISSTPGKGGIVQTVGASIGSLGTRPLSELLAYINDKPTGHNRSFKQRNQKKFTAQNGEQQPTPSPQQQPQQNGGSHPVENGVKKASKKKKKKVASPSLPVTVEK